MSRITINHQNPENISKDIHLKTALEKLDQGGVLSKKDIDNNPNNITGEELGNILDIASSGDYISIRDRDVFEKSNPSLSKQEFNALLEVYLRITKPDKRKKEVLIGERRFAEIERSLIPENKKPKPEPQENTSGGQNHDYQLEILKGNRESRRPSLVDPLREPDLSLEVSGEGNKTSSIDSTDDDKPQSKRPMFLVRLADGKEEYINSYWFEGGDRAKVGDRDLPFTPEAIRRINTAKYDEFEIIGID